MNEKASETEQRREEQKGYRETERELLFACLI